MRRIVSVCLFCSLLLIVCRAAAESLHVGEAIPKSSGSDQNGKSFSITNGTAYLLIAVDMQSAKAANQKLAAEGTGFLEKKGATYCMDIHTMPAIGKFFALKKMRTYPQRILLVETVGTMDRVPTKPERVTVLKLTTEARIEKIAFWDPTKEPVADLFR